MGAWPEAVDQRHGYHMILPEGIPRGLDIRIHLVRDVGNEGG